MGKRNELLICFIFSLVLILVFNSCLSLRGCNNDLVGRYYTERKTSNIVNFLELKADGTYNHYYKEGNTELSNTGNWEIVDDPYCKINLTEWQNYNQKGLYVYEPYDTILYINGDFLDTTPDGNDLDSFKKDHFPR